MITKEEIKTKVNTLLHPTILHPSREYITKAEGGTISTNDRNALMNSFFNSETITEANSFSATVITAILSGVETIHYNEVPSGKLADAIENHRSEFIYTNDDGVTINLGDVVFTSESVAYDKKLHGYPGNSGVVNYTYTTSASGDFFQDLNTDCLLAAAIYELANDKITDLQSQIDELKTIINNMG